MSILESKAKVEVLEEVLGMIEGRSTNDIRDMILGMIEDEREELDLSPQERVEAIADEVGGDVRNDYSGRCMYGASCYGIVTDDPNKVISLASQYDLRGARQDSMGCEVIVYWPNIAGKE